MKKSFAFAVIAATLSFAASVASASDISIYGGPAVSRVQVAQNVPSQEVSASLSTGGEQMASSNSTATTEAGSAKAAPTAQPSPSRAIGQFLGSIFGAPAKFVSDTLSNLKDGIKEGYQASNSDSKAPQAVAEGPSNEVLISPAPSSVSTTETQSNSVSKSAGYSQVAFTK